MSFRSETKSFAEKAGGSFKTVDARVQVAGRFADFLQARNIQIKNVNQIKEKYVAAYVQTRFEQGVSIRTVQNELAGIRGILRAAGREKLASQLDNKKLNAAGASRDGTKTAISDEKFTALRAVVLSKDSNVAAVIDLQRALGLRAEEALKSFKSLQTWQKQLEAGKPVRVIFGTKGGRPRDTRVSDPSRALAAVRAALSISRTNGGPLVPAERFSVAMNRYKNVMSSAGFVGKSSGHSIRYAFAREQIAHYKEQGYTHAEALAQTSNDLGHGDGRGRYIEQVYSR